MAGAAILLYMAAGSVLRNTAGGGGSATPFSAPATRRQFTSLRGVTIPGNVPWRLASLQGKVTLVNYAATWCEPCRRETPDLVAAADKYRPAGFEIVGIMMDDGSYATMNTVVKQYAAQYAISYPLIRPDDDPLLRFSGIGLPTSILLDRRGRAVRTYVGPVSPAQLSADIEELLQEKDIIRRR